LECDFHTVDTLFLKRFDVLFFIELATRGACGSKTLSSRRFGGFAAGSSK
jgi:hypothetical protein